MIKNDEKVKEFDEKLRNLNAEYQNTLNENNCYLSSLLNDLKSEYLLIKKSCGDSIFHIKNVCRDGRENISRFNGIETALDGSFYDAQSFLFVDEVEYTFIDEDIYNKTFDNIKFEK